MFNPSREEVREMFFATWRKYRAGEPLAGIEAHRAAGDPAAPRVPRAPRPPGALSRPRLRRRVESFPAHEPAPGAGGAAFDRPAAGHPRRVGRACSSAGGIGTRRCTRRWNASPKRCGARSASVRRPMRRRIWTALPRAHYAGSCSNDAHRDYASRARAEIVTRPSWLHEPFGDGAMNRTFVPAGPFSRRVRHPGYCLGRAGAGRGSGR